MMIHEITPAAGKHKRSKRVGRGHGSGLGKTSGRGHKGSGSRSGFGGSTPPGYEGGQMPYHLRLPKRGFSNARFTKQFAIVNIKALDAHFKSGDQVDAAAMVAAGLIRNTKHPVKVLGEGELAKKLTVAAAAFSASARGKIEAAGGACQVVDAD